MPIFADDHLDTAQGSAGPRAGLSEIFQSSYDQQYVVDSEVALQEEVRDRWIANLQLLQGENAPTPLNRDAFDAYIRFRRGEEFTATQLNFFDSDTLSAAPAGRPTGEVLRELEEQNEAFKARGLSSFDDIFEEVQQLRQDVSTRSAEAATGAGVSGFFAQLAGGAAGSFTTRDPTTVLTSFAGVGGLARSAVVRVAAEVGFAAATEGALQFGAVAENRRLAGEPEANKLENVLFAAGGALVLGSLLEGGVAAFRRAGRSADAAQPDINLDFEDAQLRQFLGERPGDPRARAALDLLDDDAQLAAVSPYGTSYQGLRRFSAEVAEAELALLGQSSTAIGRALPQDIPLPIRERETDFTIVRETSPAVAARYDAAEARLAAIDAGIEEIGAEVQARTVIDAVRLVDEDAAEELTQLAARTDIPEEAKTLEADLIFNRVGKDRILRAAEDAEITPRKQTQTLRASRKAASREYRAALKAMEAERVKLNAAADRVKALLTGETKDLLGYAVATRPLQGSALSRERVAAQRSLILEGAEDVVDNAPVPVLREDGMIEIGDTAIPANFRIFDEAGEPVEISRLLRDLDEDDRLAEAMRSCSL